MAEKPCDIGGIDLGDYVRIIFRRWRIILIVFLLFLSMGIAFSVILPETYQASATIMLGDYSGSRVAVSSVLPSDYEAMQELQSASFLKPLIDSLSLDISIHELKKNLKISSVKNTSVVKIVVNQPTPQLAEMICDKISHVYIEKIITQYERYAGLLNEQIDKLQKRRQLIRSEADRLYAKSSDRLSELNFMLTQNAISNYELLMSNLDLEIYNLKQQLYNSRPPVVLESVSMLGDYSIHKKKLIILFFILSGMFTGILGAFIKESYFNQIT